MLDLDVLRGVLNLKKINELPSPIKGRGQREKI